jgi:hypothetical protein
MVKVSDIMIDFFVNNFTFFAQIIGGVAIAVWVISIQNKDRKNILMFQSLANLLYSIQYFLLGAYSAFIMNFVSTFRCFIFSKVNFKKTKWISLLFCLIILFISFFFYDGLLSLVPIVITIFYTFSSSMDDAVWNRTTVLLAAFVWIFYNYKVGAYITIVGNVFEIISGIVSVFRFKK